jgi:hypothetical protein
MPRLAVLGSTGPPDFPPISLSDALILESLVGAKKTQATPGKGEGLGHWSEPSVIPEAALAEEALSSLAAASAASDIVGAPAAVAAVATAVGAPVGSVAAASFVAAVAAPVGDVAIAAVAAQVAVLVPELGLPGWDPVLVSLAGADL